MGLVNGSINGKGIYHGYAVCDLCGKQEAVMMEGDGIKGKLPWREVPFKYRRWVACSDECHGKLSAIGKAEVERDKEGGTRSDQIKSQRRPFPIVGTWEARAEG